MPPNVWFYVGFFFEVKRSTLAGVRSGPGRDRGCPTPRAPRVRGVLPACEGADTPRDGRYSKMVAAAGRNGLTGACGGSTATESLSSLDASDDLSGVDDGGAPDIAPGGDTRRAPDDVVIPDLDFGSIGNPVVITNQFLFTEGPVWDPGQQVLFFADIDGDTIHRFTPPGAFDIAFASSGHANGLAIDAQGRWLVAGFGARDVWQMAGSERRDLGRPLSRSRAAILPTISCRAPTEPSTSPIRRTASDGTNGPAGARSSGTWACFDDPRRGALLGRRYQRLPNGASLSPDERALYVSYTSRSRGRGVRRYRRWIARQQAECSREVSRFRTARPSTAGGNLSGGRCCAGSP